MYYCVNIKPFLSHFFEIYSVYISIKREKKGSIFIIELPSSSLMSVLACCDLHADFNEVSSQSLIRVILFINLRYKTYGMSAWHVDCQLGTHPPITCVLSTKDWSIVFFSLRAWRVVIACVELCSVFYIGCYFLRALVRVETRDD